MYNYLRIIFKTEYLNSPKPTEQPTATLTVTPTEQPTETPTVMPTVTPTTAPMETPEPYNYPYTIASTDMSDGTVTLRIEKGDNAPSAQVIFAEYDKGTLMNVQIEDVSSDKNKSFSKTFEYSGEDYKAFIRDAAGTMTPIAESADYYGRSE